MNEIILWMMLNIITAVGIIKLFNTFIAHDHPNNNSTNAYTCETYVKTNSYRSNRYCNHTTRY